MWIEILNNAKRVFKTIVAPFAGVWIEIGSKILTSQLGTSHPSRVCGLKYVCWIGSRTKAAVAPFAGVWIEIF